MCNSHRGGQATVELPRVRPSLPHLCMSPLGLSTQKMSAEWVFVGCRSEALGFGRQWRFLQGLVHRRRLDQEAQGTALTLSSNKWAGRASRTGTGPREGGWRKRCLCWLQRLWGWRPCLFSQRAPGMQGGGGGVPPELMDDVPHTCPRTSDWSQAQELLSPQGLPQRHLTS